MKNFKSPSPVRVKNSLYRRHILSQSYTSDEMKAGDVAYWDGSSVKTIDVNKFNNNLGTPIGVVVVPKGFAPDGRTRIVSLYWVDTWGNAKSSFYQVGFGGGSDDTSGLTLYTTVPRTTNKDLSVSSNTSGYFPSDKFSGEVSYIDKKAYYSFNSSDTTQYSAMSPSPYLGNEVFNNYYNYVLSDMNGYSNTKTLYYAGSSTYTNARGCWKYTDGVSGLKWYLPSCGEIGYLMVRLGSIDKTLSLYGAPIGENGLLTSNESKNNECWILTTKVGLLSKKYKTLVRSHGMRPFCMID